MDFPDALFALGERLGAGVDGVVAEREIVAMRTAEPSMNSVSVSAVKSTAPWPGAKTASSPWPIRSGVSTAPLPTAIQSTSWPAGGT